MIKKPSLDSGNNTRSALVIVYIEIINVYAYIFREEYSGYSSTCIKRYFLCVILHNIGDLMYYIQTDVQSMFLVSRSDAIKTCIIFK